MRSRSQEKGTASKRAELLAENPIVPNTNVGSKLKEILAETAPMNTKKNRDKTKGRWDDIMSQIAEGQQTKKGPKLKEVKSKVFADFKPPKIIRPINGSNRKISESRRSIASSERSNSTLSSRGQHNQDRFSRQNSSVVASRCVNFE